MINVLTLNFYFFKYLVFCFRDEERNGTIEIWNSFIAYFKYLRFLFQEILLILGFLKVQICRNCSLYKILKMFHQTLLQFMLLNFTKVVIYLDLISHGIFLECKRF